ncbi:hypothetical protein EUGRSUZ_L00051 [Eucalyptus grandis]|uniref:Uncharacterized protein n=2 Tax=Eucalyptus grandis TaxID=71139 RepID=A0ACC3LZ02_EUCGR|nr:hypothetical protein EUGRSUZ_L00051 [Eucalyptus grandis]
MAWRVGRASSTFLLSKLVNGRISSQTNPRNFSSGSACLSGFPFGSIWGCGRHESPSARGNGEGVFSILGALASIGSSADWI